MRKAIVLLTIFAMLISLTSCGEAAQMEETSFERDLSFEEALAICTDVAVAEFVSSKAWGKQDIECEFVVKERILGAEEEKIFFYLSTDTKSVVSEDGEEVGVYKETDNIPYEKGKEYLLILTNYETPYNYKLAHDYRMNVANIYIPMHDISQSRMLYAPIIERFDEFEKVQTRESMVEYVRNATKDNSTVIAAIECIKSDKIEDIIKGSPVVVRVKINELYDRNNSVFGDREQYYCSVIQVYKGKVSENVGFILVHADTVKSGKEYIVAARDLKSSICLLYSSDGSLFSIKQEDEITKIIAENEAKE